MHTWVTDIWKEKWWTILERDIGLHLWVVICRMQDDLQQYYVLWMMTSLAWQFKEKAFNRYTLNHSYLYNFSYQFNTQEKIVVPHSLRVSTRNNMIPLRVWSLYSRCSYTTVSYILQLHPYSQLLTISYSKGVYTSFPLSETCHSRSIFMFYFLNSCQNPEKMLCT